MTYNENPENVVGWMKKNSYPKTMFELNPLYREPIWKEGIPALILYSNLKEKNTHYHKVFEQASQQIKGFLFITSGMKEEWQSKVAEGFGVT